MDAKFVRNVRTKTNKSDPHIPPIAAAVFGVFLVAAVSSGIAMDGRVSGGWIGIFVLGMTLIGT